MKLRAALVGALLITASTAFAQRGHASGGHASGGHAPGGTASGGGTIHSSVGSATPRSGTTTAGPAAPHTSTQATASPATVAAGGPTFYSFATSSTTYRYGRVLPFTYGSPFFGGVFWSALAYLPYGPGPDFGDDATGGIRLEVEPKTGQVFVDGDYVGVVEDFNGRFDHLDLVPGPHRVEIRSTGYLPLAFDVLIQPHRTITYRGALTSAPQ